MAQATLKQIPNVDVRGLLADLKEGYSIERTGSGHFRILDPEGKPVRAPGGSRPITFAGTPASGGAHYMKRLEGNLQSAGVLKNGTQATREHSPDEVLREQNRANYSAVTEQLASVKEFLEKSDVWVKKLGGWNARGMTADLARILVHMQPELDQASAQASVSKVKTGEAPGTANLAAMWKLHDVMMEQEDPREWFFSEIREIRGLGPVKIRSGEEWPFKVELVQLDDCFPDEIYQRPVHDIFTRDLVLKFDERLVGTIDVSRRKSGKLAIMDGLQRHTVMTEVGKTACWAAVYDGMTVEEEAQFFYHKNKDRKMIHPYYHFNARVVSGDEQAQAINEIVTKIGFRLAVGAGPPEQIAAIIAVEKVFAFSSPWREECLTPTLDLIKRLWFGRKAATDGELVRGLGRFYQVYADWEIQVRHLEEILAELGPQLVIGRAKDSIINITGGRGGSSGGFGIGRTIAEIHNTGLSRAERLDTKRLSTSAAVRSQALAIAEMEAE